MVADNTAMQPGPGMQPRSVLRGHRVPVHAAAFVRRNERLVTGDAEGFVVFWDLTIMRARAVWRAHTNAILGISDWGEDKVITHGRDNRLAVWKLGTGDESALSTVLPLDTAPGERPQPWLLHLLEVNTMNFCTFSPCPVPPPLVAADLTPGMLIAVPNTLASEAIDIFHLPSERRLHTIRLGDKNGMVMALSLLYRSSSLVLIAAYENGLVAVTQLDNESAWETTYAAKAHSQPVLSLDVSPDKTSFFTSSADALIVKHPIPLPSQADFALPTTATHPPPDDALESCIEERLGPSATTSLLSPALSTHRQRPQTQAERIIEVPTKPLKVVNTRHSGQQSLKIRSDSRIFATAGWDGRIRVYSAKTMKEVAVLKWHQTGCYAAAFSRVESDNDSKQATLSGEREDTHMDRQENTKGDRTVIPKLVKVTLRDKRISQSKTAHWIAAGSKDGKVSLWDVF